MKEDRKFFYVYQITCDVTNKIYVGAHSTNDMEDGYLGSGTLIRKAIRKYGPEHFHKTILFEGKSWEELLEKEAEIVDTDFVNRNDTYNLREGGSGGTKLILEKELERRRKVAEANRRTKTGVPRSEETKQKISESHIGQVHEGQVKERVRAICAVCGKEFEVRLGKRIKGKCCSRSCTAKLMNITGVANRNK